MSSPINITGRPKAKSRSQQLIEDELQHRPPPCIAGMERLVTGHLEQWPGKRNIFVCFIVIETPWRQAGESPPRLLGSGV